MGKDVSRPRLAARQAHPASAVREPGSGAGRLHCGSALKHRDKENGAMGELQPRTREALLRVGTSTLTGLLNRRGLRSMFMQDVWPIRPGIPRMVGIAFTMRFIPSREDKDGSGARGPRGRIQSQAMETCPPGHVLVVDSRGDA